MGDPPPPTALKTWFLGQTRVHIPNGISTGSAVFVVVGPTIVANRHEDSQAHTHARTHARTHTHTHTDHGIFNNMPHLMLRIAMQPNNS